MTNVSAGDGTAAHAANISFPQDGPVQDSALVLRQLRENTRRTLQHVVSLIAGSQAFGQTPRGLAFAEDLIARICLSSKLSDALFGSETLESIRARLLMLGDGLVRVFARPGQEIRLRVSVEGQHPAELTDLLLQMTHAALGGIIRQELRRSSAGAIEIRLVTSAERGTMLTLAHDGAGAGPAISGGIRDLLHDLAISQCGVVECVAPQIIIAFPLLGRRYQPPAPSAAH